MSADRRPAPLAAGRDRHRFWRFIGKGTVEKTGTMIDWTSQESHLILNLRHTLANDVRLCDLPQLSGHLWLATSGTTDIFSRTLKLVALSKEAFLASAHGVNQHLQCHSGDIWLKVLPEFHVGGLSIYSRALLAKSQVIDVKERWDPLQFLKIAEESRATLASLVPAQVYDLVQLGHKAPDSFRAVVVGGDALSPALYEKGIQLGWPLIPTYGCTECCSQIATLTLGARHPAVETDARSLAPGGHFGLKVLPHWEGATDKDGALQFRGPALLTGYAFWKNGGEVTWSDPKQEGWWTSDDFGEIRDGKLIFHGRRQELFK